MTDLDRDPAALVSAEQSARLAALRQRRGQASLTDTGSATTTAPVQPATPNSPAGAATGGRIIAAAFGAGAMFGLVALFGVNAQASDNSTSGALVAPPDPAGLPDAPALLPPPFRIVIHRVPAKPAATSSTTVADTAVEPATTAAPTPIDLTATQVIETVTVIDPPTPRQASHTSSAPAPAATSKSGGS